MYQTTTCCSSVRGLTIPPNILQDVPHRVPRPRAPCPIRTGAHAGYRPSSSGGVHSGECVVRASSSVDSLTITERLTLTKSPFLVRHRTLLPRVAIETLSLLCHSKTVIIAVFFLVGLAIGSFLNVCITRIPAGVSIVSPGSRCPECGSPIKPYDNLPVLSWIMLRGKCRNCRALICPMYPSVDLVTAFLFVACYLCFGVSFRT